MLTLLKDGSIPNIARHVKLECFDLERLTEGEEGSLYHHVKQCSFVSMKPLWPF